MNPKNMLGLRYPDDYVIRFFFKNNLHQKTGRVLEFGCGSGNNLRLFQDFGWDVSGLDIDPDQLESAQHNLADGQNVSLECVDLSKGLPPLEGQFDVLLMPNINCYLQREAFVQLLRASKPLIVDQGLYFLRSRNPNDWRAGKGEKIERNGFVLNRTETGEFGLTNVFYEASELIAMFRTHLGASDPISLMRVRYDNIQNDTVITNDDYVLWGKIANRDFPMSDPESERG